MKLFPSSFDIPCSTFDIQFIECATEDSMRLREIDHPSLGPLVPFGANVRDSQDPIKKNLQKPLKTLILA